MKQPIEGRLTANLSADTAAAEARRLTPARSRPSGALFRLGPQSGRSSFSVGQALLLSNLQASGLVAAVVLARINSSNLS